LEKEKTKIPSAISARNANRPRAKFGFRLASTSRRATRTDL